MSAGSAAPPLAEAALGPPPRRAELRPTSRIDPAGALAGPDARSGGAWPEAAAAGNAPGADPIVGPQTSLPLARPDLAASAPASMNPGGEAGLPPAPVVEAVPDGPRPPGLGGDAKPPSGGSAIPAPPSERTPRPAARSGVRLPPPPAASAAGPATPADCAVRIRRTRIVGRRPERIGARRRAGERMARREFCPERRASGDPARAGLGAGGRRRRRSLSARPPPRRRRSRPSGRSTSTFRRPGSRT